MNSLKSCVRATGLFDKQKKIGKLHRSDSYLMLEVSSTYTVVVLRSVIRDPQTVAAHSASKKVNRAKRKSCERGYNALLNWYDNTRIIIILLLGAGVYV